MYKTVKLKRRYYPLFILTTVFLFGVISVLSAVPVAQADLLVGADRTPGSGGIIRHFDNNGNFLGEFTSGGPNLDGPAAVNFGPDGNLYVLTGSDRVFRYNGTTGVFIDTFIPSGENTDDTKDMIWGPDGNLYLANGQGPGPFGEGGDVRRFDGTTGDFIDIFIENGAGLGPPTNADTVSEAMSMAFGPEGEFFYLGNDPRCVIDQDCNTPGYMVMRFDATTGAYIDTPFPANFMGLFDPNGLTIGPDCNLYISSEGISGNPDDGEPFGVSNPNVIFRLNLTNNPGVIDEFVPSNGVVCDDFNNCDESTIPPNSGLIEPEKIVFGPDFNLYVSSGDTAEVYRYNGTTGALIGGGAFIAQGLGEDSTDPKGITFFPGETPNGGFERPLNCLGVADIPTLNEWGLIIMAGVLGIVAFLAFTIRRRKAVV